MGVGYVAVKRIRFGDQYLEPGDPVPAEPGRNYHMMVRLEQVTAVPKRGPGRPRKLETDDE